MFRRFLLAAAVLAAVAGLSGAGAAAASASTVNHCPLWASHHPYPHCYANEGPAEKAPYFYG